jgi:hypothetical protein
MRGLTKAAMKIATEVGKGLLAGLAGTAAMTLSSTLEMKLRRRPSSTAPADAAGKVLGVQPRDEAGKKRFATAVHWAYGTAWGLARAAIGAAHVKGPAAPLAHFGAVWGAELAMLPALSVAPPVTKWRPHEVAIDVIHHAVYVTATDLAYRALDRGHRRWPR